MAEYNKESVILGALLHDIGKFVQRSSAKPTSKDHQSWGDTWFQDNLAEILTPFFTPEEKDFVRRCISSHHEWIDFVTMADGISAGLDRTKKEAEEKGDPFSDRLKSILSLVSAKGAGNSARYHKLAPLGTDGLKETFPIEAQKCTHGEYAELLGGFNGELGRKTQNVNGPDGLIDFIYSLLWKYAWCIPSAAYVHEPDISLFDHSRTTAAIAACLHDYAGEKGKADLQTKAFIIASGDVSGIQPFIFDVLTQHGRTAKRLRARSFTLQALTEIASGRIVRHFRLPQLNIVYSAGGNFTMLLPNSEGADAYLEELQLNFDRWAYEQAGCAVSITLSWLACSGEELIDYQKLHESLHRGLQARKHRPLFSMLNGREGWDEGKFLLGKTVENEEHLCPSCRRNSAAAGRGDVCDQCMNDIKLGEEITRARFLALYDEPGAGYPLLGCSFRLHQERPGDGKAFRIIALNDTAETGTGFRFLATHIPSDGEGGGRTPLTLEDIAGRSQGNRLGYLKADVDNLGEVFSSGFAQAGLKPTLSRFSTLSRMLDTFFTGYLQKLLESDHRDVYTVFSGGDDMMVIGPWDGALGLANRLRADFGRYTGGNPDLTFSAGISVARHHEPVAFCVEMAEAALQASKAADAKNSVTLFGQTMSWAGLATVMAEAAKLIGWLYEGGPMSKGFAGNLYRYALNYEEFREKRSVRALRFVPELTEDIRRNLSRPGQEEPKKWAAELLQNIDNPPSGSSLPYLRTIMEYALTHIRSKP